MAKQRIDIAQKQAAGRKGGRATARKGANYFRALQALRSTRAGGRPAAEPIKAPKAEPIKAKIVKVKAKAAKIG